MNDERPMLTGPGIMLISAAIFGYFGFGTTFNSTGVVSGKFLLYVPILEWTLKGAAGGFLVSGLLAFRAPRAGNLLYGVIGLLSAALFLVVAVMDYVDKQHQVMSPVILLIFAAWNGFGSWSGLRSMRGRRPAPPSTPDR